jgi:hypothetical protein
VRAARIGRQELTVAAARWGTSALAPNPAAEQATAPWTWLPERFSFSRLTVSVAWLAECND